VKKLIAVTVVLAFLGACEAKQEKKTPSISASPAEEMPMTSASPAEKTPTTSARPAEDWSIAGPQFESSNLNFQLSAPEGWTWSEDLAQRKPDQDQYSFIARRDPRTFFRVIVRGRDLFENSERTIAEYLQGIEISNERSRIAISELTSSPRKTPAGSGYAYSYQMQLPQGVALADGYVLAAGRHYILQYVSADRAELPLFERFVDSFTLKTRLN